MKLFPVVLLFAPLVAMAQHAGHGAYTGQEARDIKALSADEVKQYRAGAGMGFAKAAELNGFPGPQHVLELADKLKLTPDQRAKTQALMESHKAEARSVGEKVVAAEAALEQLFRSGKVDAAELENAVQAAAHLQGEYRLLHLDTHVRMKALLTPAQASAYSKLRGY